MNKPKVCWLPIMPSPEDSEMEILNNNSINIMTVIIADDDNTMYPHSAEHLGS